MGASAEKYWYGYGNGATNEGEWDYDNAGGGALSNWRAVSDNTGCDAPKADDIVHIDSRAYYNTVDLRYQDIINCELSGAPNVTRQHVKSSYNGNIATSGAYLELECRGTGRLIIYEGTGAMYLNLEGSAVDAECTRFVHNGTGTVHLASDENNATNSDVYSEILAFNGNLYIDDDTALTKLQILSSSAIVHGGTGCKDLDAGVDAATIRMFAGLAYWDSPIYDYLGVGAGTFNWGTDIAAAVEGLDIENLLECCTGNVFNWTTKDATKSIVKKILVCGGTVNAGLTLNSAYPKEIGDGTEKSEIWNGGSLLLNSPNQNISIASGSKIINYSGTIATPANEEISW